MTDPPLDVPRYHIHHHTRIGYTECDVATHNGACSTGQPILPSNREIMIARDQASNHTLTEHDRTPAHCYHCWREDHPDLGPSDWVALALDTTVTTHVGWS